tara:strand:- start:7204 stop:7395 length:192 start_codon:yes stop_codon:yes gene_type:complete
MEIQKTQFIRFLDFTVFAAFLFSIAAKDKLTQIDKNLIFIFAAGTLFYNLNNFIKNKRFNNGI